MPTEIYVAEPLTLGKQNLGFLACYVLQPACGFGNMQVCMCTMWGSMEAGVLTGRRAVLILTVDKAADRVDKSDGKPTMPIIPCPNPNCC